MGKEMLTWMCKWRGAKWISTGQGRIYMYFALLLIIYKFQRCEITPVE